MKSIFSQNLEDLITDLHEASRLDSLVQEAIGHCIGTIRQGGKILLCGNGGSAADCQHFAAELVGRFVSRRGPLPALALTTDTSAITCISNDFSFADIFSRPLSALGKEGDCLFAISTSGNSENVSKAVLTAHKMGIKTIGLLGKGGGTIKQFCDVSIVVNSDSTARIQEIHMVIIHSVCEGIEDWFEKSQPI